jgi:hypothetical protein
MSIKAKPTYYKGILFRSRLEALWAHWFDCNGFNWQYEPEITLSEDGTMYTPDFLIDKDGVIAFVEVKPTLEMFNDNAKRRIFSFIRTQQHFDVCHKFILIVGQPHQEPGFYEIFDGNYILPMARKSNIFGQCEFYTMNFSTGCFTQSQWDFLRKDSNLGNKGFLGIEKDGMSITPESAYGLPCTLKMFCIKTESEMETFGILITVL